MKVYQLLLEQLFVANQEIDYPDNAAIMEEQAIANVEVAITDYYSSWYSITSQELQKIATISAICSSEISLEDLIGYAGNNKFFQPRVTGLEKEPLESVSSYEYIGEFWRVKPKQENNLIPSSVLQDYIRQEFPGQDVCSFLGTATYEFPVFPVKDCEVVIFVYAVSSPWHVPVDILEDFNEEQYSLSDNPYWLALNAVHKAKQEHFNDDHEQIIRAVQQFFAEAWGFEDVNLGVVNKLSQAIELL